MSEPALKYENNASFEQIYTQKLLIAFKMACYCCFSFGGNLDFPEFLQKNIYNINYWGNNCRNILPLKTVRLSLLKANRSLFHKTFFFVIYGHFAVNYGIFTIYEQIYGQNLAVTTNP